MNIDSINYTLILYTAFCILLGIFFCWFYLKKMISTQSQEIDALGESLNELLKKHDTILADKIELDKQFAILKQAANRIPEIEEELKFQQKQFSTLQVLNATLEERLESKENESREKIKFLEEAKKLMGTEFENLSAKIFTSKS